MTTKQIRNVSNQMHCSNNLTGLPLELGEVQKLRVLRLKYNAFEALPPVLSRFRRLEILELADNKISCLDDEILSQLTSVKYDVSTLLHMLQSHSSVQPAISCTTAARATPW